MFWVEDKEVGQLWVAVEEAGGIVVKAVQSLYVGAILVWEAVSSCFGSGYWREMLPWKDNDAWKDD